MTGGYGGRSGTVRVASWGRFPRQFGSLFELVQSYMYRVEGPKISIRVTPGSSPAACCHRMPLWARLWTACDLWRGGFGRWGPFTAVARLFRADGLGWPGGPRQTLGSGLGAVHLISARRVELHGVARDTWDGAGSRRSTESALRELLDAIRP